MLLPQYSYQYPNLSEGADRVGGQLRGDKECPFSGVTESGGVWRKVSESDARSVRCAFSAHADWLIAACHSYIGDTFGCYTDALLLLVLTLCWC